MGKLKSTLTSLDTFSIATGAMFSSGFFLLPGLAAAATGTSVVLAYLLAGLLMVPAMLCQAELATAMPKAGGAYYFVDRALGPLFGSVAGWSTWVALVLKSAFALVGLGAFAELMLDVPATPVALGTGALFIALNAWGADHSARAQRWLVGALLFVLFVFLAQGAGSHLAGMVDSKASALSTAPLLASGWSGLASTVGLVAVSYAGLTKVASVAEEVQQPDVALPFGMFAALIVTTAIYVAGTALAVATLPADTLFGSVAPMVDVARAVFPAPVAAIGAGALGAAAVVAFATTANAGILAAARYPFAMARDGLVPPFLARVHGGVPRVAVLCTGTLVLACSFLDILSVAKLASAVQLLLFVLLAAAVVVMRESHLVSYAPGYHVPWYPWVPLASMASSLALLLAMGPAAMGFAGAVAVGAAVFYIAFARGRVSRRGVIWHAVARWASRRCGEVERELGELTAERALRDGCHRLAFVREECLGHSSRLGVLIRDPRGFGALPEEVRLVSLTRDGERLEPSLARPRPGDRLVLLGGSRSLEVLFDPLADASGR